jgi:glycosyltransferase involved in cell wall biosynthesis
VINGKEMSQSVVSELNDSSVEDISIVMCVYNHEATVAEAIESVLKQNTKYEYAIYCLNDASTDNSADVIQHYVDKYPDKVKIFTSPKNLGIGKKSMLFHNPPVNGKYWCLLAGDDYWTDDNKLRQQIDFLEKNNDYVGCASYTVLKDEVEGTESFFKPRVTSFNLIDLHIHRGRQPYYVHPSSIIWKNIYRDKLSFLPPAFRKTKATGDVMLKNAMLACGKKMNVIPTVMSCYRFTGKGVWSRLSSEQQVELNKNILKNTKRILPWKWRCIIYLQKVRQKIKCFQSVIPGPIND